MAILGEELKAENPMLCYTQSNFFHLPNFAESRCRINRQVPPELGAEGAPTMGESWRFYTTQSLETALSVLRYRTIPPHIGTPSPKYIRLAAAAWAQRSLERSNAFIRPRPEKRDFGIQAN